MCRLRSGWFALGLFIAAAPVVAQTPGATSPSGAGSAWTGFYLGAAFGGGGAVNTLTASTPGFSTTFDGVGGSGVLGSVYGGFDYRISERGVLGLLAELTYSGFQGFEWARTPSANASVNLN
jgi:hypothetical protein